ncbi:hypothetical protein [Deinococcus roseus]|uniref:Beta-xylosidase C-terminal Concanavalin A-like domain-containing protein n=1 Tax=Deinococcus roseus TaxID=392414 RepID=A0ABQ2D3X0_9DEIO|nr:hypothetical protein [Deinococcus roseus]GGJ45101.1 hypothetical protein GCM10008938_34190 [Deinococcus roseus]
MSRIPTPVSTPLSTPVQIPAHPLQGNHPDPASCQMARKVHSSYAELIARMEFNPSSHEQRAGLSIYYNSNNWAFLHMTQVGGLGRCLKLSCCDHGRMLDIPTMLQVPGTAAVHLGVRFAYGYLQFYVSMEGLTWRPFGDPLKDSVLSAATGTFVMLCSQEGGTATPARFVLRSDQEYRAPENLRGAQMFMLQAFPFVRSKAHHAGQWLPR